MINCGYTTKEDIQENYPNWQQNPDHLYKILIFGGSRSGKRNVLLNLIKQQNEDNYKVTDKMHFNIKDPNEAKYQYLMRSMKIQRLLWNIQIICWMSIKILKRTIQIENVKY